MVKEGMREREPRKATDKERLLSLLDVLSGLGHHGLQVVGILCEACTVGPVDFSTQLGSGAGGFEHIRVRTWYLRKGRPLSCDQHLE